MQQKFYRQGHWVLGTGLLLALAIVTHTQAQVSFSLAGSFPVVIGRMVVADFNRDGALDVAGHNGAILLGDGNGSFGPATAFPAGVSPSDLATADFNRDGILDLAVANAPFAFPVPAGAVSVLLGDGTGSFGPPTSFTVGARPLSIATGDFNVTDF